MAAKYYWIKERHNPQTGCYYTACGQLKISEAKRRENSVYGFNIMHRFASKVEYESKLAELKISIIEN